MFVVAAEFGCLNALELVSGSECVVCSLGLEGMRPPLGGKRFSNGGLSAVQAAELTVPVSVLAVCIRFESLL